MDVVLLLLLFKMLLKLCQVFSKTLYRFFTIQ